SRCRLLASSMPGAIQVDGGLDYEVWSYLYTVVYLGSCAGTDAPAFARVAICGLHVHPICLWRRTNDDTAQHRVEVRRQSASRDRCGPDYARSNHLNIAL